VPRVFEPGFCACLVAEYDRLGVSCRRSAARSSGDLLLERSLRSEHRALPEFGHSTHRAPLGGAIVFSCSLLHEATPVTAGRRYCTVPYLYDEAGEAVRMRNLSYVGQ
jgi:hypothetical protein